MEEYIICYLIPVYRNGIMYYMYEYFRAFSTYEEAKEFIIENNMEAICKTTIFTKYQYEQFKNKTHRGLIEFEKVKAPYHKMMKNEICIQDNYDKRILSRRYGNVFECNNCGRSWIACKDDILEGYELDVKLRCPYCHNMINIPRNFNWH